MRAREPDIEGYVDRGGVKLAYEVFGDGPLTLLLLPTWTIIHSRFWKAQVPYLSRHARVVTYDGPGNGRSDRPLDAAAYSIDEVAGAALDVLDAVAVERAVLVSLSAGALTALHLTAHAPDRVLGSVFIGPAASLAPPRPERARIADSFDRSYPALSPSAVPSGGTDPDEHWAKYNRRYWADHYEDFAWFFFGRCFTEPHSTKQIEDCVGWALETSPQVLSADADGRLPGRAEVRGWAERTRCPVLVIHGSDDAITPLANGEALAAATGGDLVVLDGAGHIPLARDPVKVNLLIRDFAERLRPPPPPSRWTRARRRRKRALYLSSPIGLGHAQRDVAVARELRRHHPDLEIDWLAQHPVTRVLEAAGEHVHPASAWLASESAHIESESGEHDLHCFQAWRRMDEILVADFMVFHDVVRHGDYDLVIGDEAWDVDYFLHENPELKRFAYVWFTDFIGWLPMGESGSLGAEREAFLTADYNAEMISQIARYPRVRDRALFVGDPEDIVPERFGPDLPLIREWTQANYDFAGYVTGFDPTALADRAGIRADLGYGEDERVCVVTVGGSGVGGHLLRRVIAAYPEARRRVPSLRMIVVAGPRIDPATLPAHDGLEVRAFVPELYRHLAVCDLAVVQGGLTTCMELTATGRPFVYVPLRHHFEQNIHVRHRLERYRAGRRLDFEDASPDALAEAIASEIGRPTRYRPVDSDGAARAAALIAPLL
jgi:pimeloyl-ACP methyl ester carboxylesterase/predicted glycosyltransferase